MTFSGKSPTTPGMADRRGNLWILGCSVVATIIIWELIARWFLPAPLPWRYPQLRYRPDPILIFSLRPDQEAYTADKPAKINSRGLRGELIPYERTSQRLRLLFLGDSIAFGYGVDNDQGAVERVVALLREAGLAAEAINSSVPSYNTAQEIAYLEHEGIRYRPDWVILTTCWNDVNEKSTVWVSPEGWLLSAGNREPGMMARVRESPASYAIHNFMKRSRLLYGAFQAIQTMRGETEDNARLRTDVLEGRESPQVVHGWSEVAMGVRRLHQLSQVEGFRALIVAFPLPLMLDRPYHNSSYPERLRRIAAEEGVPFLDLGPVFGSAYRGHESLFIPYDGDHPNAHGHDLAAREIVRSIQAARAQEIGSP